jgi:hypothetical protein
VRSLRPRPDQGRMIVAGRSHQMRVAWATSTTYLRPSASSRAGLSPAASPPTTQRQGRLPACTTCCAITVSACVALCDGVGQTARGLTVGRLAHWPQFCRSTPTDAFPRLGNRCHRPDRRRLRARAKPGSGHRPGH